MAGDCFWTALVNCFDDCGAAPPPPPPGDNIVFGEDFSTLPNARAPSAGPVGFTSSSNAQVGVSGGFMASTVASADDGYPSVTFTGPGTAPAIGMKIGVSLTPGAFPTSSRMVYLSLIATETGGIGMDITLRFRVTVPGEFSLQASGGIGDNHSYAAPEDGGYMQWGGAQATHEENTTAITFAAAYEFFLRWDGTGFNIDVDGVETLVSGFSGGALSHFPEFDEIKVGFFSFSGTQQALAIDYVRLIGEP